MPFFEAIDVALLQTFMVLYCFFSHRNNFCIVLTSQQILQFVCGKILERVSIKKRSVRGQE